MHEMVGIWFGWGQFFCSPILFVTFNEIRINVQNKCTRLVTKENHVHAHVCCPWLMWQVIKKTIIAIYTINKDKSADYQRNICKKRRRPMDMPSHTIFCIPSWRNFCAIRTFINIRRQIDLSLAISYRLSTLTSDLCIHWDWYNFYVDISVWKYLHDNEIRGLWFLCSSGCHSIIRMALRLCCLAVCIELFN